MYKVQVTPLIGLPRFDGWAHVTTIAQGRVVWALSVAGQHARNIGRDLLDIISSVEQVESGAALYSLVTQLIEDARNKDGELSLACGWLNDQGKSVFCCYQGSIILKRNGKSGHLLQANGQLKVIEGSVSPEDVYIFATTQAAQFLGEVQQKLEQGYEIDTIVTSITPSLHLEETTALSAMAFVKQEPLVKTVRPEPVFEPAAEPDEPEESPLPEVAPEPTDEVQPVAPILATANQPVGNVELTHPAQSMPIVPAVDWSQAKQRFQNWGVAAGNMAVGLKTQLAKLPPLVKAWQAKRQAAPLNVPLTPPPTPLATPTVPTMPELPSEPPVEAPAKPLDDLTLPSFLHPTQPTSRANVGFGQEVYVGTAARRQSVRTILVLAVIVVVIVGAGGFFLFRRQQEVAEAAAALQPFEQQIQQAKDTVNQDPISARANLQQAIAGVETLQVTFRNKTAGLSKIDTTLKEAKAFYDEVSGREEFSELSVFFNSRNDTVDIVITQSGVLQDALVFFDAQKKQGAVVKLSDKAITPFTLELDKEVVDLATNVADSTIWTLADAVHQFNPGKPSDKPVEKLAPSDRLSGGKLISVFSNAVYVLSPSERTILKYTQDDDTFTGPIKWFKSAQGLDFEQVVSMVVDGDIWLTDKKGGIFRLRGGNAQDFSVKGLEQPFKSSLIIYTTEESEKLYILEPDNHRMVILSKNGEFLREVTSSSLAAASHIVVSPDETKLFAVSGSTVYEVSL